MQQDRELARSLRQLCGVLEQVADKLDGNEHAETGDVGSETEVGLRQWESDLLKDVVRYAEDMKTYMEREDWGLVASCALCMREDLAEIDINDLRYSRHIR